ncbi:MAG: hypothetical protein ABSH22_17370 [Tepidisphaeraceae bacterium]
MSKSAICILAAAAAIIAAPLAPLLIFPSATFNLDWTNNLWMVAYLRAFFTSHGYFPHTYNVALHVGIPQPIFYGPFLYPCLALFSLPAGAAIGVRVACIAVWTLQFFLVWRLSRAAGATRLAAFAAGATTAWSVYSLTNLYNRGALSEFIATSLLLCAVAGAGLAILEPAKMKRLAYAWLFALCAALAVTSHGPTALVGGPLMLVLGISCIPLLSAQRRHGEPVHLIRAAMPLLAAAITVAPWVYVVTQNSGKLTIQVPDDEFYPIAGKWQRWASIDSAWPRLKPLPIDDPWTPRDATPPGTRYLDAQWNLPLVMMAVWNAAAAIAGRRGPRFSQALWLMAAAAGAGMILLAVSISPALQAALPVSIAGGIQFPYRLVSHVNIAAFALLIGGWIAQNGAPRARRWVRIDRGVVLTALALSAAALGVKLDHIVRVKSEPSVEEASAAGDYLSQLPTTFVGQSDYSVQIPDRLVPASGRADALKIDAPAGRGPEQDVQDVQVQLAKPQWVVTSILNFPWNRLIVDGKSVPFGQVHNLFFHEAVELPAGIHTVGYEFEPDPVWIALNDGAWTALAVQVAVVAVCLIRARKT